MYDRFSPRARRAIQLSNQSCCRFDHFVEPGKILPLHILDGMLQVPWGGANDIFAHFVLDTSVVRDQVVEALRRIPGKPGAMMGKIGQSDEVKLIIQLAIREAEDRKSTYVGTEHLLSGIVQLNDSEPVVSLLKRWLDYNTISDHFWVITYDTKDMRTCWKDYREWYQWRSRNIDDFCLKAALTLARDGKAQFGCRIDDAIDLMERALDHATCPKIPTADWLSNFVKQQENPPNRPIPGD